MRKIYLSYILVLLNLVSISAQSNIRLNNYWGNMHSITPAWIYDKYMAVFNMSAKKQWVGVEGSPATFYVAGTTYFETARTQLGASLLQDKIGYTSFTNINLSYAYNLRLDYLWELHLGVAGNYQQVSFDLSKVIVEDGVLDYPLYDKLKNDQNFNADVGVELSNYNFKFGVASQNIVDIFTPEQQLQVNSNFIYARYRQYDDLLFNWGVGVCGIQYTDIYQCELNVTGYFKNKWDYGLLNKPDIFDIGLFYRTHSQMGMIVGFNLTDNLRVSYSYDYHFGSLRYSSYGTNEIMLTLNINRKPYCHNCWY